MPMEVERDQLGASSSTSERMAGSNGNGKQGLGRLFGGRERDGGGGVGGGGASAEGWKEIFSQCDEAETRLEKFHEELEEAIRKENYPEAGARSLAIKQEKANDPVENVASLMAKALEEEDYELAARLRDEGMMGITGWWSGCADPLDTSHPHGHLIWISAAYGRYVAKAYLPEELLDLDGDCLATEEVLRERGSRIFEVFIRPKADGKGYEREACFLRHSLQGDTAVDVENPEESITIGDLDVSDIGSKFLDLGEKEMDVSGKDVSENGIRIDSLSMGIDLNEEDLSEEEDDEEEESEDDEVDVADVGDVQIVCLDQMDDEDEHEEEEEEDDEEDDIDIDVDELTITDGSDLTEFDGNFMEIKFSGSSEEKDDRAGMVGILAYGDDIEDEDDEEDNDEELEGGESDEDLSDSAIEVEIDVGNMPAFEEAVVMASNGTVPSYIERERGDFQVFSRDRIFFERTTERSADLSEVEESVLSQARAAMEITGGDSFDESDIKELGETGIDAVKAAQIFLNSQVGPKCLSRRTHFSRLSEEICSDHTDPFEGLFVGTFGPHGPEVIQLRRGWWGEDFVNDPNCVTAVKVTGDQHVPAGKASFRFRIGKGEKVSSYDQTGLSDQIGLVARYAGEGRMARRAFEDAQWVEGELLQLDGKAVSVTGGARLGFAWLVPGERKYMILFHRLHLPQQ